jgi:hypothetical protein
MTHFIADFTDGKQLRLFARRQAIVAHAGLAKLFRHFGKVPGVVIDLRRNPQIGQRFFLGRKWCRWRSAPRRERPAAAGERSGLAANGTTQASTGLRGLRKMEEVLVYRFFPLPQPCGQFQEYAETG